VTDETLPLWVEELGHPPTPGTDTFLLLHGYGGSSFSWRTWVPALAARGRVLLVDMKGFGRAPKPDDGRYAPADLAAVVLRLIELRDLSRLTLVGHSLGGGVALYVALGLHDRGDDPRLTRLVLVASAAYPQRLPPFVTLGRHPGLSTLLMRVLGPRFVVGQALRSIVFDRSAISNNQIRGYAAPLGAREAHAALWTAARQILPPDLDRLTARYPELKIPTLLLWGRQDPAVPLWVGQRLSRTLPRSTLRVLERCGHLPAEERPEESLAALLDFLDVTT